MALVSQVTYKSTTPAAKSRMATGSITSIPGGSAAPLRACGLLAAPSVADAVAEAVFRPAFVLMGRCLRRCGCDACQHIRPASQIYLRWVQYLPTRIRICGYRHALCRFAEEVAPHIMTPTVPSDHANSAHKELLAKMHLVFLLLEFFDQPGKHPSKLRSSSHI